MTEMTVYEIIQLLNLVENRIRYLEDNNGNASDYIAIRQKLLAKASALCQDARLKS